MCSERPVSAAESGTFTGTARRAQFVAAAIDTIAEAGYAQASLGRIAERVGVSKGVISYHFAGKGELVREVVVDVTGKSAEFIRGKAAAETTAAGRLRTWIEANLEFMAAHRKEMVAVFEIAVGSRGDAAIGTGMPELLAKSASAVRELLVTGQAAGEFRKDFDPQAVAMAIRAAIDVAPRRLAHDPDFDVAAYGRELAGLFDVATRSAAALPGGESQ